MQAMDEARRGKTSAWRNAGFALATLAIVAGIAALVLGHGVVGTSLLVGGGVTVGLLLPAGLTSTSDVHGGSDSTD
jgi:hypothetical protein